MANLLEETKKILHENGKTIFDVVWFGTSEFVIGEDIQRFFNVDYDNSYGSNEIPMKLIAVGEDFWLERHEYDGSEWWEYKEKPSKPKTNRKVGSLLADMWYQNNNSRLIAAFLCLECWLI